MRKPPRSLEEWLYYKLMDSQGFHRFVGKVYRKVNNIQDPNLEKASSISESTFKPSSLQMFKAYRMLFWDEIRGIFGLPRKTNKYFKD